MTMTIHLLRNKPGEQQLADMLQEHDKFIKLAVDVHQRVLAGGGEMHADCEEVLLDAGCLQEHIWGADWIPGTREVRYTSFINIRPRQNNRQMELQDPNLRAMVESVVREIFE